MGKLVKHQWARLLVLTAAAYLTWAAFWGFFYPKSFFDMFTPVFNGLVAPLPVIQIINLLDGIVILALEWPLPFIRDKALHRAFALRFALYPIMAVAALIQYQCTDPAFYLLIGTAVYFQAWAEGETIVAAGTPQKRNVCKV